MARLPRQKIFLADFVPLTSAPAAPKIGTVVCADGDRWDPLETGENTPYLVMSAVVGEGRGWVSPIFSESGASATIQGHTQILSLTAIIPGSSAAVSGSGLTPPGEGKWLLDVSVQVYLQEFTIEAAESISLAIRVDDTVVDSQTLGVAISTQRSETLAFVNFKIVFDAESSVENLIDFTAGITGTIGEGTARIGKIRSTFLRLGPATPEEPGDW